MEELGFFLIAVAGIVSFELGGAFERRMSRLRQLAEVAGAVHGILQVVAVTEGTAARDRVIECLRKQSQESSARS